MRALNVPEGILAAEAVTAPTLTDGRRVVVGLADGAGRSMTITLSCDGGRLVTRVEETYESADSAAAAFHRVKQRLIDEGAA